MSDSVGTFSPVHLVPCKITSDDVLPADRVFVHALNTVKRIPRTGSARPPESDRLRLYGLYKQSTESDVERVMSRPHAGGKDGVSELEKWEAWHSRAGLSRTEAKRQYISTLIETMHKYATTTSEARELVAELEFVWDQIKSNSPSSAGSSPGQVSKSQAMQRASALDEEGSPTGNAEETDGLRVLRPFGEEDKEDEIAEHEAQYYRNAEREPISGNFSVDHAPDFDSQDRRWKKRVEQALSKLTTEIAAIRELLDATASSNTRQRKGVWEWLFWCTWVSARHLLINAILIGLFVIASRRKRYGRIEQALRVLVFWSRERLTDLRISRHRKRSQGG